jgi:hypothetical protein
VLCGVRQIRLAACGVARNRPQRHGTFRNGAASHLPRCRILFLFKVIGSAPLFINKGFPPAALRRKPVCGVQSCAQASYLP